MTDTIDASDVLELWFGDRSAPPSAATKKQWFSRDEAFDSMLRERFGAALVAAREGELDAWAESADGALALVILLDQFGRNCGRDTPAMYSGDAKALALAEAAIARGFDREVRREERSFFYMPFMHSESLEAQERCVELFRALEEDGSGGNSKWAIAHRDIVARFGRFPHRNEILGRESTPEEIAFLKEPGSSF